MGRFYGVWIDRRKFRQHLGGAADHGRGPVDRRIAGEHPQRLAEGEIRIAEPPVGVAAAAGSEDLGPRGRG